MFKFVILALSVASANAGVLTPTLLSAAPASVAVGPALGATWVGRTTVNAPETTIVKQQVVVDQPEIRYRAVPTIVQTVPQVAVARTVLAAPQLVAAPQQVAVARNVLAAPQLVAAPQQVAVARNVLAAPQLVAAPQQVAVARTVLAAQQLVAAPQQVAVARTVLAAPQQHIVQTLSASPITLQGNTIPTIATPFATSSQLIAGIGSQTLLASPTSTLLSSPTILALKK